MASTSAMSSTLNIATNGANAMLVTELLGYHPQLLLDELMSSVNETVYESTSRVEEFLNNWIDEKERKGEDVEHLRKELDQGIHALQTLLENYADLAFDFFEAWSHRNIFVADTALPIVAPHQQGLDLDVPLEKERDLQIEVETLRRKLDNMRIMYARIRRSEAQAAHNRRKAEALLKSISFVETTASETEKVAKPLAEFLEALRKLYEIPIPPPAGPSTSANASRPTTSREAYLSWAVDKMMKDNALDKISAKDAEDRARAIFDSDDSAHTGSSSLGRLPPELDDEDSIMSDSTTDEND